jgi:DNA-binding GntR family transcriptional regulator
VSTVAVIGAGIAGLSAAAGVAGRFDSVLLLDRDQLPDAPVPRRGVPQPPLTYLVYIMDTAAPSAATRVYQHLKRAILEQIHAEGALLSEAEIAASVGVSRTPVREALLRLSTEGLVALFPKRGILVRPVSAAEIEDVIDARLLVEVHAAGRAWARRGALAGELEPLLDAMREARERLDVPALMAADRAFHEAVVAGGGNAILTELYQRLRDRQMRIGIAAMRIEPDRMDHAVADHTELLDALRGDDPARWTALVERHVRTAAVRLRPAR